MIELCAFANLKLNRKLHPDGITLDHFVFDLGFGERGLLDNRPHDRLGAAIELAGLGKFHQLARDDRFGIIGHGEIGVLEIAGDAEPLEFLRLHTDPMRRKITTFLAEFVDGDFVLVLALGAIGFLDLPFDRQAVAVPAGDVIAVKPAHLERAGDDVLQHLVEGMADMEVAVGIGRAVMEHIFRPACSVIAQAFVEVHLLPAGEDLRLLLRQSGAHRKLRLRQVEGGRIIAFGGVGHGVSDFLAQQVRALT